MNMSREEFEHVSEHREQLSWGDLIYTVNYVLDPSGKCNGFQIRRNNTNRTIYTELIQSPGRVWREGGGFDDYSTTRFWRIQIGSVALLPGGTQEDTDFLEVHVFENFCSVWDGSNPKFTLLLEAVREVFGDGDNSYVKQTWIEKDKTELYHR
jgi:hypothetical protein